MEHLTVARFVPMMLQAAQTNLSNPTAEQLRQQIALEAVRSSGRTANSASAILALLVPFGAFAMVAIIVWLRMRQRQVQIQVRAELHKQLLDKFSSGPDFAEFLESKGGQRFLSEMWSQNAGPRDRILKSVRIGVVCAVLGLALIGLAWMRRQLLIPGGIVLAVGTGYLISTAISYRISKKWDQERELVSKHEVAAGG